jgi:hypothetical protein
MQEVKFEQSTQYIVMQEYADTVVALTKRIKVLDEHIQSAANESVFWPVIQALMALRGMRLAHRHNQRSGIEENTLAIQCVGKQNGQRWRINKALHSNFLGG